MANGPQYQFGDTLIPTLAKQAANLDNLQEQALRFERQENRENRQFAIQNKRMQDEKEERDRIFKYQKEQNDAINAMKMKEFELKKEQSKIQEMQRLVNSVEEPYQKAMIYNKYGQYDLANNFADMGDKQEKQKDILREFDSYTEPTDILENSTKALKGLDPTSEAATHIRNARQKAEDDLEVKWSELLEIPGFRVAQERYIQASKDPMMSDENKQVIIDAYQNAFKKYGAADTSEEEDDGLGGAPTDDEINSMVDEIIGGRGLNLSTGNNQASMEERATKALSVSKMSLGKINKELETRKKIVSNLKAREKFEELSPEEEKQILEEERMIEAFESRMNEAKKKGRAAGRVLRGAELNRIFKSSPPRPYTRSLRK